MSGTTNELGWKHALGGALVARLIRILGATWRIHHRGRNPLQEGDTAQLGAIWHRDLIPAAYVFRDRGFLVPISRSEDGDFVTAVVLKLGYRMPARGSSSRGGSAALRAMVRQVRDGTTTSIITDGPRGPARKSKLGIVSLARLTGVYITGLTFSARPILRFSSWDRMILPLPFARVLCHFDEPLHVPPETTSETEEELLARLDAQRNAMTDALDRETGLR